MVIIPPSSLARKTPECLGWIFLLIYVTESEHSDYCSSWIEVCCTRSHLFSGQGGLSSILRYIYSMNCTSWTYFQHETILPYPSPYSYLCLQSKASFPQVPLIKEATSDGDISSWAVIRGELSCQNGSYSFACFSYNATEREVVQILLAQWPNIA